MSDIDKPRVICVVGATATGKSDFGLWVAEQVNGEVLSADSMQVYQGMDIGTAKLHEADMQGVPHYLIDIVDPRDPFTVANWVALADSVIQRLHEQGKVPVVVGGTGLYIRGITEDLDFAEKPGSELIRAKWSNYGEAHGSEALYQALRVVDEQSAARLHPNDVRRVIRALEVWELRAQRHSETYDWQQRGGRYRTLQIGLRMDRAQLYERVNLRVDAMMDQGLLREVAQLLEQGVPADAQSMQAIGYKELVGCLHGDVSLDDSVSVIKQATRRYVKRQTSWFNRDERIHWLDKDEHGCVSEKALDDVKNRITEFLAGIPDELRE